MDNRQIELKDLESTTTNRLIANSSTPGIDKPNESNFNRNKHQYSLDGLPAAQRTDAAGTKPNSV